MEGEGGYAGNSNLVTPILVLSIVYCLERVSLCVRLFQPQLGFWVRR